MKGGACRACFTFGVLLPWGLLLIAGFVSLFPQVGPEIDRLAAYFMATALIMLIGSVIMHRFPPKRPRH